MSTLLKDLSLSTLLIVFVWLCGGLYLVGFWGTFNVDALALISLADIPKNVLYPFTISLAYTVIFVLLVVLLLPFMSRDLMEADVRQVQSLFRKNKQVSSRTQLIQLLIGMSIMFIIAFSFLIYFSIPRTQFSKILILLQAVPLMIGFPLTIYLHGRQSLKQLIANDSLRLLCIGVITLFIFQCYCSGKLNALAIVRNRDFDFIVIRKDKMLVTEPKKLYKFLGFTSNEVIISDTLNGRIVVLEKSAYDEIRLFHYRYRASRPGIPIDLLDRVISELSSNPLPMDSLKR